MRCTCWTTCPTSSWGPMASSGPAPSPDCPVGGEAVASGGIVPLGQAEFRLTAGVLAHLVQCGRRHNPGGAVELAWRRVPFWQGGVHDQLGTGPRLVGHADYLSALARGVGADHVVRCIRWAVTTLPSGRVKSRPAVSPSSKGLSYRTAKGTAFWRTRSRSSLTVIADFVESPPVRWLAPWPRLAVASPRSTRSVRASYQCPAPSR